jgi:hypothetical protein
MASAIDDTKPVTGTPTTQSVRDNFAAAKSEITALQAAVPTWTVGSVPFAVSTTALGQDNAHLFYDNANDRLGIGMATPAQKLDVVVGSGTGQATDPGLRLSDGTGAPKSLKLGINTTGSGYSYIQSTFEGTAHTPLLLNQAGGNVGIGTTITATSFNVAAGSTAGTNCCRFLAGPAGADTTSTMLQFTDYAASVAVGAITRNGTNTVAYGTSSDERLKEQISDASLGLEELLQLKVRQYNYKQDDRREHGLIAQEVQGIYPLAVIEGGDDAHLEPWMIDYGRLTPLLIKAVQDLAAQVDDLKAQLAATKPA